MAASGRKSGQAHHPGAFADGPGSESNLPAEDKAGGGAAGKSAAARDDPGAKKVEFEELAGGGGGGGGTALEDYLENGCDGSPRGKK